MVELKPAAHRHNIKLISTHSDLFLIFIERSGNKSRFNCYGTSLEYEEDTGVMERS